MVHVLPAESLIEPPDPALRIAWIVAPGAVPPVPADAAKGSNNKKKD
jgi:hypothetical protein